MSIRIFANFREKSALAGDFDLCYTKMGACEAHNECTPQTNSGVQEEELHGSS